MSTTHSPHQQHSMGWSTGFAITVHLCVLFGFAITLDRPPPPRPTLEITLAAQRSASEPERADFLAQENQAGSGTLDEVRELTTTEAPQKQTQASASAAQSASRAIPKKLDAGTTTAPTAQGTRQHHATKPTQNTIETIRAKLDRQRQVYGRRPRIHRMTSVATRQSEDARYQLAWQQRVEKVGNHHYPDQARRQRLSGDVRLVVAIFPDGRIKEINVLVSSGQALLDQAAIRSVQLAAPFAPFPENLREKADILEIIRTWQFRNNMLTST